MESCRTIRRRAGDLGLTIPVYGSYLRAGADSFADDLETELSIVESLDADLIRVWAGEQEYGDHDPDHWDRVVEDVTRVSRSAADRDLEVTVEKHANTLTNAAEGAKRLVDAVDSDTVGVNWQPSFWSTPEEIRDDAELLAPLSNNVHVLAVSERNGPPYSSLSNAYFDLETVLRPILASDFDGYANVEFVPDDGKYGETVTRELEYLRSIVD